MYTKLFWSYGGGSREFPGGGRESTFTPGGGPLKLGFGLLPVLTLFLNIGTPGGGRDRELPPWGA